MIISSIQREAFKRQMEAEFEEGVRQHLRTHFSGPSGSACLRVAVAAVLAAGRRCGLQSRAALLIYASFAAVFGAELERDRSGTLREILDDSRLTESEKTRSMTDLLRSCRAGEATIDALFEGIRRPSGVVHS